MRQIKPADPIRRGEQSQVIMTGRHSYGVENIKLLEWNEGAHLFIGSFCSIAPNQTVFLGGNHVTEWTTTYPFGALHIEKFPNGLINGAFEKGYHPATKGHVVIENDVWIGHGCTIMSGVRIGSGSIIASNSVVTKDVRPYSIAGGNPARLIRLRFPEQIIQDLLDLKWWDRSDEEINMIIPLLQSQPNKETISRIVQILK